MVVCQRCKLKMSSTQGILKPYYNFDLVLQNKVDENKLINIMGLIYYNLIGINWQTPWC